MFEVRNSLSRRHGENISLSSLCSNYVCHVLFFFFQIIGNISELCGKERYDEARARKGSHRHVLLMSQRRHCLIFAGADPQRTLYASRVNLSGESWTSNRLRVKVLNGVRHMGFFKEKRDGIRIRFTNKNGFQLLLRLVQGLPSSQPTLSVLCGGLAKCVCTLLSRSFLRSSQILHILGEYLDILLRLHTSRDFCRVSRLSANFATATFANC